MLAMLQLQQVTKLQKSDIVEDDPKDELKTSRSYGVWIAAAFIITQLSGIGLLNLPKAFSLTGWSGIGVILFVALLIGFLATRISLSWTILEEHIPHYKDNPHGSPYQAIAEEACGKGIRYIVDIIFILTLFGVSCVGLLLMGQILRSLLLKIYPNVTICPLLAGLGLFLMPLTFLGSPKNFWFTSIGATVSIVLVTIFIVVRAIQQPANYTPTYPSPSFASFIQGIGPVLYCFGGTSTFPTIQNDMKDKSRFPDSIKIAYTYMVILYITVGTIGYTVYGIEVEDNILFMIGGPYLVASEVFMFANLLFSFFIMINPVMQSLEERMGFSRGKKSRFHRIVTRTIIMIVVIVTTEAMPRFGESLTFLGGLSVSMLTFVFPPLFYMRLAHRKDESGVPYRVLSYVEIVILVLAMLLGTFNVFATLHNLPIQLAEADIYEETCI